ncbi:hypothetical protein QJS10_CPB17g01847 [Acorus calamus]|uniref:Glycosyltransferase 61 catalytic domain-containing protein n=1 Tax=Acorus calamus TaxID=4465 RepID=A0AAV9CVM9_ACOCL|nr:hypothetical protein QJS10_CPB17g01847 [Acorus calamus]
MVKHYLIRHHPKPNLNSSSLESQHSFKHHHHLFMEYYNFPNYKKSKPKLFRLFFLFVALCFFYDFEIQGLFGPNPSPTHCSWAANNTICCDRTGFRSDVCYMRGDVRTHSASASLVLHDPSLGNTTTQSKEELIRPYTRKWESSVMGTIDELHLVLSGNESRRSSCDVVHDVPAVVFSTGGYTGNVYHEFNDGILPLFITSKRFNKKVVFLIVEYHNWWVTKYADVVSRLSDHPPIDFSGDNRTHCFPEAIVGLSIHDELSIDPKRTHDNRTTIFHFRALLDEAYRPRARALLIQEEQRPQSKPRLTIVSRNGSRAITNERELAALGERIGFKVAILRPERTTELAEIYGVLNASDAMVGVHGAAMTHFLFMRPGTVFVQVVPLGTDWAAENYYGEPAVKMGLKYIGYKIKQKESSLYMEYERDDPVLCDPESVNAKGWETTKRVYLDGQNVSLDLRRFRKRLVRAYEYLMVSKRRRLG